MLENLKNVPKNFPLGYHLGHLSVEFGNDVINKKTSHCFWFRTIHGITWEIEADRTKSAETNILPVKICQKDQADPFHSIVVDYEVLVKNVKCADLSIELEGNHRFGRGGGDLIVEISDYDKITESRQGFFDSRMEQPYNFKIYYNFIVRSVDLCDSVEYLDFYSFDPAIHDVQVNVMGYPMFLNKAIMALQSPTLAELIESKSIPISKLPKDCEFDDFYDFLQIVHGVDLKLDVNSFETILALADHLRVPRITDYCKKQIISGNTGMDTNQTALFAKKRFFWDVVPRLLGEAHSLAGLRKQEWDLENLPNSIIRKIMRRILELKC